MCSRSPAACRFFPASARSRRTSAPPMPDRADSCGEQNGEQDAPSLSSSRRLAARDSSTWAFVVLGAGGQLPAVKLSQVLGAIAIARYHPESQPQEEATRVLHELSQHLQILEAGDRFPVMQVPTAHVVHVLCARPDAPPLVVRLTTGGFKSRHGYGRVCALEAPVPAGTASTRGAGEAAPLRSREL